MFWACAKKERSGKGWDLLSRAELGGRFLSRPRALVFIFYFFNNFSLYAVLCVSATKGEFSWLLGRLGCRDGSTNLHTYMVVWQIASFFGYMPWCAYTYIRIPVLGVCDVLLEKRRDVRCTLNDGMWHGMNMP